MTRGGWSCCWPRISGSGRRYGPSSMRLPSLRQSSNLQRRKFLRTSQFRGRLPVWKDNLYRQLLRQDNGAFLGFHCQSHNMSDLACDFGRIEAAHCEHSTSNCVRISIGEVCATDHNIRQEKSRIWIVLPRICELVAHEGRIHPCRFDDRYEGIACSVVLGKVKSGRDDVRNASELKRIITVAVKESASTVQLQCLDQL